MFLSVTQAAFINGLEIVLNGAFALAPVVLALLLTSRGGQALFSWASSIAGLYATQLICNTITGVLSLFILSRQINVTVGGFDIIGSSTLAGLDRETFQVFVAILAPLISLNLGYGQFSRALAGSFGTARFLRGGGSQDAGLIEQQQRNL